MGGASSGNAQERRLPPSAAGCGSRRWSSSFPKLHHSMAGTLGALIAAHGVMVAEEKGGGRGGNGAVVPIWLFSHHQNTARQQQERHLTTCTAHMHGLMGMGPASCASPCGLVLLSPRKGLCLAICQHHFHPPPPLTPSSTNCSALPRLPQGKRDPSSSRGSTSPRPALSGLLIPTSGTSRMGGRGGGLEGPSPTQSAPIAPGTNPPHTALHHQVPTQWHQLAPTASAAGQHRARYHQATRLGATLACATGPAAQVTADQAPPGQALLC